MDDELRKYPRTAHLVGSRLQTGDTAVDAVSLDMLTIGQQVWEEKLDGANTGISFDADATLRLQSRGHFLTGGFRERQYDLFKSWAQRHVDTLFDILTTRYILYGEWVYAKHTVFYDQLTHYFFEFDMYDRDQDVYLDTPARHRLLATNASPIISVPVVHIGRLQTIKQVRSLIQPSLFKSAAWRDRLLTVARAQGISPEQVVRETDPSPLAEGLYLKVELDGRVIGRYKFIRPDFLQTILESGSHWATRPILPNQLAPHVDIFA